MATKETLATPVHFLYRQILHDLGAVYLLVMRRIVQVKHEVGQPQNLKVKNDVPEHHLVVSDEVVLHQNLVALLRYYIDKLFVKLEGWQQLNGVTSLSIDVAVFTLAVHFELWNELLLANRTLAGVTAQVSLEAS